MNWLFLNPLQALALWIGAGALALWFYLHTRRPLRRQVSTLRFWAAVQPVAQPLRRHLREPWALLAQLIFLLLLILALANPRWGVTSGGRSAVLVLDTSIWSQVRQAGDTPWIEKIRQEAQKIVDSLPAGDPVLLLPAVSDAPPLLPFTTDRAALRGAIAGLQASSTVPDLTRALEMGQSALSGSSRGVLVYVGPGMLDEEQAPKFEQFRSAMDKSHGSGAGPQFLVRLVSGQAAVVNRGITRLSMRRDTAQPDRWHLLTQIKNYNDTRARVGLRLSISGQSIGEGTLALAPNGSANAEDEFVWAHGGVLEADILSPDALDADNHAIVNLPTFRPVQVALYSTNFFAANDFQSVLAGNPYLQTTIVAPNKPLKVTPEVAIYEGVTPPGKLQFNSIWFLPGLGANNTRTVRITKWNPQHPATRWIRTTDVSVDHVSKLTLLPDDTVLAETEGTSPEPLIVARNTDGHKLIIIGFDPRNSNMRLQSAFPLLMASSIEWMTRPVEETAESLSVGEIDLPGSATRIIGPSGKDVVFARNGADLHLLASEAGLYRVIGPGGESILAVNPPLLPAHQLQPTEVEKAAVEPEPPAQLGLNLWRWLLIPAFIALWIEWWLYYQSRRKAELADSSVIVPGSSAPDISMTMSGISRDAAPAASKREAEFARQGDA